MNKLNGFLDIKIQTEKGLRNISEINIGDRIYSYTDRDSLLTVMNVVKSDNVQNIYQFGFTDGRLNHYSVEDNIYIGGNIVAVKDILMGCKRISLVTEQRPIMYPNNVNSIIHKVDPYCTGALLIYGDYNDPYINLPIDRPKANKLFVHKYHLSVSTSKIGKNKIYFDHGEHDHSLITWEEFFNDPNLYMFTKITGSPIIPDEYLYASYNNRWQFVRGVFDVGFSEDMFREYIGINHSCECILKEFQKILWSLGIVSKITYYPYEKNGRKYRLEVIDSKQNYPGFFYDIENIEEALRRDNQFQNVLPRFDLELKQINWDYKASTINLVLDHPRSLYVDEMYMPRVSL